MADRQIDPARLQGEALRKWYLRSPNDLERERQAAAAKRYRDFFRPGRGLDPGFSLGPAAPARNIDPRFSRGAETLGEDIDPGFSWVPAGPNKWRSERATKERFQQLSWDPADAAQDPILDRGLAGPDDRGELLEIGNPHNRRLKREHIDKYGSWPKTEDGRDYDVAHRRATADGGTNTLDNIEPMHPDEHKARHRNDGDNARWARRARIARAFGGKVEPPKTVPKVHGFGGALGPLNIHGIMSGRIRTDSLPNFASDMVGMPSPDDIAREREARRLYIQRQLFPDCPPGADCI